MTAEEFLNYLPQEKQWELSDLFNNRVGFYDTPQYEVDYISVIRLLKEILSYSEEKTIECEFASTHYHCQCDLITGIEKIHIPVYFFDRTLTNVNLFHFTSMTYAIKLTPFHRPEDYEKIAMNTNIRVEEFLAEALRVISNTTAGIIIKKSDSKYAKQEELCLLVINFENITDPYLTLENSQEIVPESEQILHGKPPVLLIMRDSRNGNNIKFPGRYLKYLLRNKDENTSKTAFSLLKDLNKSYQNQIDEVNKRFSQYFDGLTDSEKLLLELNDE